MLKKNLRILKIVGLLALPISLWMMPATFFDEGTPVVSVFAWLGVENFSYSTGMTRAVMHLLHLDIEGALQYNKLSFLVLPLLMMFWAKLLLQEFDIHIFKWIKTK